MNIAITILIWSTAIISVYFAVFWFLVFLDDGLEEHPKKKLKNLPSVTLVIPAWNEGFRKETGEVRGVIETTIEQAANLDYPPHLLEIIVVNDASTDNTRELILNAVKKYPNITFIDKKKNGGKWRAMNDALKIAKGEFLVSLDGDSTIAPDLLKKVLPYFTSENISCVCPNMVVMKPKNFIEKMQWYEYVVNMFYKKLMSAVDCVHVAPGPFSTYRTSVLRKLGGFKHGYKTEDLEITYRMQKAGYKILQVLDVKVQTKAPPGWKAFYRQRNRWFRGAIMTTLKDYRDLAFNKKYGDFGMIQIPTVLISGILALVIAGTFLWYNATNYYHTFIHLWQVDFDMWSLIQAFSFNFNILDLNYTNMVAMISMMALSIMILKFAHKASKEKVTKEGIIPLVMFFFFYYLVLSVVWVGVLWDMLWKRNLKW